jgi:two-component system sensor histidine kinase AgrC
LKNSRFELKKVGIIILTINILQIGLLIFLLIYSFITPASVVEFFGVNSQIFLILLTIFSLINGFISIKDLSYFVKTHTHYSTLQETINSLENLNNSLRAQRHDFLNHLQVVYGLMQMEEYKDAKEYIDKVYDEIQKVSRVLRTANPTVNALLQAKLMQAEKKNILTEVYIASRLDNMPVPSWDLCRILGNLLDNAIAALENRADGRLLKLSLKEDLDSFYIHVENNGPVISEKHMKKIFLPGFTTKSDASGGMGLSIVKNILDDYGGKISVTSVEDSTLFAITIPREDIV